MATTKSTPDSKSTEQRGKDTSLGNTAGRANTKNEPGDRSATNDEARNTGLPGTQRKGAEQTQAGNTDRNTGSASATNKVSGDRTDREVAGSRTTGQNPTGTRKASDELRGEDEEDVENLPTSEDLDADDATNTDDAEADDSATTNAK